MLVRTWRTRRVTVLSKFTQKIRFKSRDDQTDVERMLKMHKCAEKLVGNSDREDTEALAVELYQHWGDALDETREGFVKSCLREFDTQKGNVLLSSASLLTFILGAVSEGDKQRRVWCLEHDAHWTNTIRNWISRFGVNGAYVIRAPIAVIGGMVRYQIMTRHLPKNISMVVCERTGAAPGATLSTLVTVAPHLADDFTVFARRVDLHAEAPLIKRWAMKHGANFVIVDAKEGFLRISRKEGAAHGRAVFNIADAPEPEEIKATA